MENEHNYIVFWRKLTKRDIIKSEEHTENMKNTLQKTNPKIKTKSSERLKIRQSGDSDAEPCSGLTGC